MRRKPQTIENLLITDIVAEGKSLGRHQDIVVFVTDGVPGDIVDVQVVKKKSSFYEAKIINFQKYSDLRIQAPCKHFGICGGCRWQNIEYDQQLKYKQKIVQDAFDRIAKVPIGKVNNILGSQNEFFYRNKLEFTFSTRRWLIKSEFEQGVEANTNGLGFHLPRMFDRIINIEKCHLQSDLSNQIRNATRDFAIQNNMEFADTRNKGGFLRNLIIRNSITNGEYMVIVVFGEDDQAKRTLLLDFIIANFPQIASLQYFINTKVNDTISDLQAHIYHGNPFITEVFGNLKFQISAKSFFQTNTTQAKNLYDIALNYAELSGEQIVYDLYTGTGTIALYASQKAKKVIGIESIAAAIDDAKQNASFNNITNCDFVVGEVEKVMNQDFFAQNGNPDVIILDPPRAGLHPRVIETIIKSKPTIIVYVSCNPGTQARDIGLLQELYNVQEIQPVDMFPHTFHVENVAKLTLKQ